jgi:hypothetical protein
MIATPTSSICRHHAFLWCRAGRLVIFISALTRTLVGCHQWRRTLSDSSKGESDANRGGRVGIFWCASFRIHEKVLIYLCIWSKLQNIANHIAEREELHKARRFFQFCFVLQVWKCPSLLCYGSSS